MLWLDAKSSVGEIPAQPEHVHQCHRVSTNDLDGSMMEGLDAHLYMSPKVVLCARRLGHDAVHVGVLGLVLAAA
jgi:hypothetical protein